MQQRIQLSSVFISSAVNDRLDNSISLLQGEGGDDAGRVSTKPSYSVRFKVRGRCWVWHAHSACACACTHCSPAFLPCSMHMRVFRHACNFLLCLLLWLPHSLSCRPPAPHGALLSCMLLSLVDRSQRITAYTMLIINTPHHHNTPALTPCTAHHHTTPHTTPPHHTSHCTPPHHTRTTQDGQALYCDIPNVLQLKKRDADAQARARSADFARPCKVRAPHTPLKPPLLCLCEKRSWVR